MRRTCTVACQLQAVDGGPVLQRRLQVELLEQSVATYGSDSNLESTTLLRVVSEPIGLPDGAYYLASMSFDSREVYVYHGDFHLDPPHMTGHEG